MMEENRRKQENSVNLVDLFFYLLSYWYWFVLCVLVCAGLAYYKYAKTPFVYRSDATVVIKDPSNTKSTVRMDNYNNLINRTNVSNEILQFQSKQLMQEVVKRLGADVDYTVYDWLRRKELYTASPIKVNFPENSSALSMAMKVTPKNETQVLLEFADPSVKSILANLNDSIETPMGKLVVSPTLSYNKNWFGKEVEVTKYSSMSTAKRFLSRMQIRQTEEEASILSFSLQDFSAERARDILNMLFVVYNEEAINDKNQVAINTANFINERLLIIEKELGNVESELESFKVQNRLMSADESASMYLGESRVSNATVLELDTRLELANYIKSYLTDASKQTDLIPANTGLDDARVEGQISQYNNLKLQRDKFLADSSEDNPVIQEMNASLNALRQSIIRTMDNLIVSLEVKKKDAQGQESRAISRFTAMPSKAKQMLSIERQQSIKESLYMFLLNRREENALTQAMVDNNARVIDEAESIWMPISPNRNKLLLLGVLIGLAIPALLLIARLFLDTRVRTRKEVEEAVQAPFIGEIPMQRLKKAKKGEVGNPILYERNSRNLLTEALRIVSTNMEFMTTEDVAKNQVVTFTSFNVGAGKTFVALNLAACLADGKSKVVVVDFDLRKRTLSKKLNHCHKNKGASNFIYDKSLTVDDIIVKEVRPGLA